MSRNAFFSSRSEKNIFFDVDFVVKKQIEMWFSVVCTLIDNDYASLLFSQTFFCYCFCMLSEFAKVFERKVWSVQVAHLHELIVEISQVNRQKISRNDHGPMFFCSPKPLGGPLYISVLPSNIWVTIKNIFYLRLVLSLYWKLEAKTRAVD